MSSASGSRGERTRNTSALPVCTVSESAIWATRRDFKPGAGGKLLIRVPEYRHGYASIRVYFPPTGLEGPVTPRTRSDRAAGFALEDSSGAERSPAKGCGAEWAWAVAGSARTLVALGIQLVLIDVASAMDTRIAGIAGNHGDGYQQRNGDDGTYHVPWTHARSC